MLWWSPLTNLIFILLYIVLWMCYGWMDKAPFPAAVCLGLWTLGIIIVGIGICCASVTQFAHFRGSISRRLPQSTPRLSRFPHPPVLIPTKGNSNIGLSFASNRYLNVEWSQWMELNFKQFMICWMELDKCTANTDLHFLTANMAKQRADCYKFISELIWDFDGELIINW